jgi:hypothetical protein
MKKETPRDIDSIFRDKFSDFEVDIFPETEEEVFAYFFSEESRKNEELIKKQKTEKEKVKVYFLKSLASQVIDNKFAVAAGVSAILLVGIFLLYRNDAGKDSPPEAITKSGVRKDVLIVEKTERIIVDNHKNLSIKEAKAQGIKSIGAGKKTKLIKLRAGNEKLVFFLPDSSKVYLNRHTEVSYLENFSNGERTINISGEGYFDIKKSKKDRFIVNTGIGNVEVLGTSFNVKSLSPDKVEVIVESGKVLFYENVNPENKILLIPGMKGYLDSGKPMMSGISHNPNELSWKTNRIIFNQTPMINVIQQIEAFYGIKVKVADPRLYDCHFTGKFYRQDLVQEVLETLSLSINGSYQLKNKEHILRSKGCN